MVLSHVSWILGTFGTVDPDISRQKDSSGRLFLISCTFFLKGHLRKKIQEIKNSLPELSFCLEISGSTVPKVPKIRENMAQDHSRLLFFFSKILAKYFLRYRDFGDFLVLDYNEPFVWAPRIIFCVNCFFLPRPNNCLFLLHVARDMRLGCQRTNGSFEEGQALSSMGVPSDPRLDFFQVLPHEKRGKKRGKKKL